MRLNFAHLFPLQQAQSDQTVGLTPLQQFLEAWNLFFTGGDDDLAANFMLQVVLAAKLHHGSGSLDAKLCFQGSRLVVDAGVNHAAVVPALMTGHPVFLFDQQQPKVWEQAGAVHRGRETYDASADHDDIKTLIRHNGIVQRRSAG